MGNKHELQLLVKKRNYLRGGTQWDNCHHENIAVKRYINLILLVCLAGNFHYRW